MLRLLINLVFSTLMRVRVKTTLVGHTNSDWDRAQDEQKSTSGYACFLGPGLVSWLSKK